MALAHTFSSVEQALHVFVFARAGGEEDDGDEGEIRVKGSKGGDEAVAVYERKRKRK